MIRRISAARAHPSLFGLGAAVLLASGAGTAQPAVPSGAATRCPIPEQAAALPTDPAALALERGNQLWSEGETLAARDKYRESRTLALASGNAALATLALANAGRAELGVSPALEVQGTLAQAVAEAEALMDPMVAAHVWIHIGKTYAELARTDASTREVALLAAADVLQRASAAAAGGGDARSESLAQGQLGALYEGEGQLAEALQLTRRALFLALEAQAPETVYRWQWQLGRIERASGRDAEALSAYRQAVATLTELRLGLAASAPAREATFRTQVEPLYLELVDLLLRRVADTGEETQALLAEARDALEDLKAAELRDYFNDPCLDAQRLATPESIPGAVVVYPILLPDRIELIVGRAGRLARYRSDVSRDTLTAEVRAFRSRLERVMTRQYLRHARRLYDWLIRPIEPALSSPAPEVLVIVPGGPLRTIPFGALHDEQGDRFLVERFPVAVAPSLTLTEPRPIDRAGVRLLAAGISEAIQGYPALENVADEMAAVRQVFEGEELLNAAFGVKPFEDAIAREPHGVVHVASHAEFFANPTESFVLAYDGRISIDRLAALIETTRFRTQQPLELLTLSACETAAGDDRAALGLAGVAVRSGARSALATLWAVHDGASAELVSEFYRQLADPAVSRAEALRRAQLRLLRTSHFGHPVYWSPFLMINSWL